MRTSAGSTDGSEPGARRPGPTAGASHGAWPAARGLPGRDQADGRHRGHRARAVLAADQVTDVADHRCGRVGDRHRQLAHGAHAGCGRVEPVDHPAGRARGHAARQIDLPVQDDRGRTLERSEQVPDHGGLAGGQVDPLDGAGGAGRRLAAEHPDLPRARGHRRVTHRHREPCGHPEVLTVARGEHPGIPAGAVVAADHVGDRPGRHAAGVRPGGRQLADDRALGRHPGGGSGRERLDGGHAGHRAATEQVRVPAEDGTRGIMGRGGQVPGQAGAAGHRVQAGHRVRGGSPGRQPAREQQPARGGQRHLAGQRGRQLVRGRPDLQARPATGEPWARDVGARAVAGAERDDDP